MKPMIAPIRGQTLELVTAVYTSALSCKHQFTILLTQLQRFTFFVVVGQPPEAESMER